MQIQINTNTNQCKYKSIQIQINTNANTNMSQLRVFDLYAPAVRLLKCLTGEHARNPNKDKYKFKFTEQILVNKSDKSDHPNQQEPWCFVEVVNKVSVRDKTSSPQHSRCSYGSGAHIRIYFHPETAEK